MDMFFEGTDWLCSPGTSGLREIAGDGRVLQGDRIALLQILFKALALWAAAFYKSVRLCVRVFVRLFVCLFTFEVLFKRLFAPTSRNRMSDIFRDLESLEKSNGKKWSQIGTFLFEYCQNFPCNFFFFLLICLTKHGGNRASRWIRDLWSKAVSLILAYLQTFLSFCVLDDFFPFFTKNWFLGILGPP